MSIGKETFRCLACTMVFARFMMAFAGFECVAWPEEKGCLSAKGKEKMTHTISPMFCADAFYGFYQVGETHTIENVVDPTELMRLSVLKAKDGAVTRSFVNVGIAGQDFGSFVQTAKRPPCAQTAIERDGLLYLFFRGRREDMTSIWCYRNFDTRAGKLTDGATICTLDGREFNGATARDVYNRTSGDHQTRTALANECTVKRFSDGWYYMIVCVGGDCVGLVVRSQNLKDWSSVAVTPDLGKGPTMEHEIAELAPGKWFSAWRQERLGGVWTASYDVSTRTWSVPERVPDSIAVKPCLFAHRGKTYLATNLTGPVTTPGYGTAVRATLGVFEVSADGRLRKIQTIVNPTGCHYVGTVEDGAGNLYLCHSTDERKLDVTQCRSNISFFRFEPQTAVVAKEELRCVETPDWKPSVCWRGFNLLGMFRAPTIGLAPDPRVDGHFVEWEFRAIRDWGFNFVRLPIDYRILIRDDDWSKLDEGKMKLIDQAIAWGRQYGIHVQIALHRIPGYCILDQTEPFPLGTSPVAQEAASRMWAAFAKRWKGIPNEDLSFNLFNEPTRHTAGANYVPLVKKLIVAIRAEDSSRFIMIDGNACASVPVPEVYGMPSVGQAFRGYTPHALTHYLSGFAGGNAKEPPTWPLRDGYASESNSRTPEATVACYQSALDAGENCMVGEFGCRNRTPHAVTLAWMEHCLKLWNSKNIGWALWNLRGHNGILDSGRDDVDYEDFKGHKLDRKMLNLLRRYAVTPNVRRQGVLVLSFDDRNFAGWEKAIPLFAKYGAHATFFVSGPIDSTAVKSLKKLVAAGHSAGLHGLTHANADAALAQKGAEKYFGDDIVPQKDSICCAYIPCSSFAYPNCRRNEVTDELFWSKGFARVRGGVKGATPYDPKGVKQSARKPLVTNESVFFPASELPKRRRLDTIIMGEAYHTDITEILACLDRIAARKEVLTITSHDIAPDAKDINMKTEWLEAILKHAKELGIPVLGFDELPAVAL